MSGWMLVRTYGEPVAWAKVLIDTDGFVRGAHLIGPSAPDLLRQEDPARRCSKPLRRR